MLFFLYQFIYLIVLGIATGWLLYLMVYNNKIYYSETSYGKTLLDNVIIECII